MSKTIKLTLTPLAPRQVIDANTSEQYVMLGESYIIQKNRPLFDGHEEICVDTFYYALVKFVENGQEFCVLTPYRNKHKNELRRRFSFGAYDTKKNKLFLFFNGVSKSPNREHALQVYNELKSYCEHVEPSLKPFAIKI